MKIACLWSGHLRTFRQNDSLKPMFLDVNPPMDHYVHTYSHRNFHGQKWHDDDSGADDRVTYGDNRWIRDLLINVRHFEKDERNAGHEYMPDHLRNCGFRHTRERVNQLLRQHCGKSRYDLVVMMRLDIGFREPFKLPETIDGNTLYAAYNGNMAAKGLDSDTITWGHPVVIAAMNIPAVPEELSSQIDSNEWCGEKLCTAVRKMRGFDYQTQPVRHFFYRSHGKLDVLT